VDSLKEQIKLEDQKVQEYNKSRRTVRSDGAIIDGSTDQQYQSSLFALQQMKKLQAEIDNLEANSVQIGVNKAEREAQILDLKERQRASQEAYDKLQDRDVARQGQNAREIDRANKLGGKGDRGTAEREIAERRAMQQRIDAFKGTDAERSEYEKLEQQRKADGDLKVRQDTERFSNEFENLKRLREADMERAASRRQMWKGEKEALEDQVREQVRSGSAQFAGDKKRLEDLAKLEKDSKDKQLAAQKDAWAQRDAADQKALDAEKDLTKREEIRLKMEKNAADDKNKIQRDADKDQEDAALRRLAIQQATQAQQRQEALDNKEKAKEEWLNQEDENGVTNREHVGNFVDQQGFGADPRKVVAKIKEQRIAKAKADRKIEQETAKQLKIDVPDDLTDKEIQGIRSDVDADWRNGPRFDRKKMRDERKAIEKAQAAAAKTPDKDDDKDVGKRWDKFDQDLADAKRGRGNFIDQGILPKERADATQGVLKDVMNKQLQGGQITLEYGQTILEITQQQINMKMQINQINQNIMQQQPPNNPKAGNQGMNNP
jgi:hypothetical protein